MHCVTFRACFTCAVLANLLAFAGTGCKQQGAATPVATPVRTATVQTISRQNGATY